jgi:hypothetical protein
VAIAFPHAALKSRIEVQEVFFLPLAGDETYRIIIGLFEQTIDIRYKDIDIGFGKLVFVLIGNYAKGAGRSVLAGAGSIAECSIKLDTESG